ncbi:MAG: tetraacyldisaccharide 4'-kinase [Candidatus Omnitrophica bacterium]|nr:tetraacyldisaccharide 4'-kinase [Candidatus Omnitrophota bacterium]
MLKKYLYLLATDKKKGVIAEVLRIFLFLLSLIYTLAIKILSSLRQFASSSLNCKVISVGNITLGGTGKTSLVQMLAGFLKANGHKVAILSRGYARSKTQYAVRKARYEIMGDEPFMLSKNLEDIPVIVNSNRIRAGRQAISGFGVDTVILDDGFQQWSLKKDLNIVTIDSTNPFGNFRLIPRGIMREPLSSLKRADIFVLTKTNLNPAGVSAKEFLRKINKKALIVEAVHRPVGFYKLGSARNEMTGLNELSGRKVSLVSGIADPQSFEALINNIGVISALSFRFDDHHRYSRRNLKRIMAESKKQAVSNIVTTEKDAVRFPDIDYQAQGMSCYVLRVDLEVLQHEIFFQRINSIY